jgi:hypothetical protein
VRVVGKIGRRLPGTIPRVFVMSLRGRWILIFCPGIMSEQAMASKSSWKLWGMAGSTVGWKASKGFASSSSLSNQRTDIYKPKSVACCAGDLLPLKPNILAVKLLTQQSVSGFRASRIYTVVCRIDSRFEDDHRRRIIYALMDIYHALQHLM